MRSKLIQVNNESLERQINDKRKIMDMMREEKEKEKGKEEDASNDFRSQQIE